MTVKQELEEAVAEKMAKGMTRERAVRAVFKADPELRQRLVDEANSSVDRRRAA